VYGGQSTPNMTGDCANNNCIGSSLEARSDGRFTAVVTVGTNELLISSSSKALLSAAKDVLEDFLSQQHTKEWLKREAYRTLSLHFSLFFLLQ
jgi:hypothetical protein